MPEVPDSIPERLVHESYEDNRTEVRKIVEDERHNARKLWPDEYPADVSRQVTDRELDQWWVRGLEMCYLPSREIEPNRIRQLPYRFDNVSLTQLECLAAGGHDPFSIEGGWYVIAAQAYDIDRLDNFRAVSPSVKERWPMEPRVGDVLYGLPSVTKEAVAVDSQPRLPTALELLYFANTGKFEHDDLPEEVCSDPITPAGSPQVVTVRFERSQGRVLKLRTTDRFTGGVRPMWKLPAAA